jgi:hypothetical protein
VLVADYSHGRPKTPFPYFGEVLTGLKYAAAVWLLQARMEAECGHHYGCAMASWAAVLAWTGFQWSGGTGTMRFVAQEGRWFWSNGEAWGTCEQRRMGEGMQITLEVLHGFLACRQPEITGVGAVSLDGTVKAREGEPAVTKVVSGPRQA